MLQKRENDTIFIPYEDEVKLRKQGIMDPVGLIGRMLVGFSDNIDSEIECINKQLNLV